MLIVDRLEPVEIEEDQSRSASGCERILQLAHELGPIEQTGQPVMRGLIEIWRSAALRLLSRHNAHRPQDRAIVVGQHGDGGFDQEIAAVEGPLAKFAVPVSLPRHDSGDLLDVGMSAGVEHLEQFEEPAADRVLLGDPYSFWAAGLAKVTRPCVSVATTASDTWSRSWRR